MRFKTQPSDVFLNFFIRYGSSNSVQVSQSLKNRLDVLYRKIELQQQTSKMLFRLLIGCNIFILVSFSANAQVGIGTTSPKATLDIEANNRVNPGPNEGLLIPRVDSMPVINPGADQEGMLVYLTTTSGSNSPGLYVWNNIATSWINIDKAITTLISDADSDTKIQVEKNADEDIIRFNIAGAEQFRMEGPRLEMNGSGRSIFLGNDAGLNDDLSDNKNVFIGNLAGQSNTTGSANLGIGFESLTNSITGSQNIAIGNNSQSARTIGDNNTSLGFIALQSNRGSRNVSIGAGSLLANTTGNNNVAIGTNTGANATGDNNVFLGYRAGENETGSNKLIIENSASLSPLLYGEFNNNILRINGELQVGNAFAFPTIDGAANQVLSTDGAGTVSWQNAAIDTDNQTVDKLNLNGTTLELSLEDDGAADYTVDLSSLNTDTDTDDQTVDKLNLNGTTLELSLEDDGAADYTVDLSSLATATNTLLVDTDGDTKVDVEETADEDILRFDLAGTEYFTMNAGRLNVENTGFSVFLGRNAGRNDDLANRNNVFIGDVSGTTNTTGIFNVGVGSRTLRDNTTGQYNIAIGGQALLLNTTGNQNTAVGMEAMFTNTTGANNVAIGRNALHQNTLGSDNVAVGYEALDANTTGTINNAFGSGALTENTTGIHNAAYGYNAMQDNTVGTRNAAFGNNSLRNNTTGSFNTALGYIALDNNLTGQDNVAVGYNAGKNSTGSDNIYVGTQAGINQTAGDNNIVIGTDVNLTSLTGSNQLNIGDLLEGDLSTGAVSINSNFNVLANGSLLMQANGGTNPVGITQNSNVGGTSTLELTSMDGSSNQATRLLLRGNINNADIEFYRGASGSESKTMHIEGTNGNVGIGTGTPNYLLEVNGTAAKPGGGAWTATSDKRLKENIKPYKDGLDLILNIAPVRYHYNAKSGYDTKQEHIGVIAQDLKKVAPYMVFDFNKDNTSYLNVDNSAMTYALINSVKSQNEIITSQQAEIDALKMRIQKSEETNNATKRDMETLKTELLQIKAALKGN